MRIFNYKFVKFYYLKFNIIQLLKRDRFQSEIILFTFEIFMQKFTLQSHKFFINWEAEITYIQHYLQCLNIMEASKSKKIHSHLKYNHTLNLFYFKIVIIIISPHHKPFLVTYRLMPSHCYDFECQRVFFTVQRSLTLWAELRPSRLGIEVFIWLACYYRELFSKA